MNENNYVLHAKNGVVLVTESQAINNALDQEKVALFRVTHSWIIKPVKTSHRPDGSCGQLLWTDAALCTADLTEK